MAGKSFSDEQSRLCDQCQSMVQTMAPGAAPTAPVRPPVAPPRAEAPPVRTASPPPAQTFEAPPQQGQPFQPKAPPQPAQTFQPQAPPRPVTTAGEPPRPRQLPPEAAIPTSKPGSGPLDELAELFAETPNTGPLNERPKTAPPQRPHQPAPPVPAAVSTPAQPPVYLAPPSQPIPQNQQWDTNPLQHDNWPMIVEPQTQVSSTKKFPTMLISVVVFLIAAAGGYFLVGMIYKKETPKPTQVASLNPTAATQPRAAQSDASQGASKSSEPNKDNPEPAAQTADKTLAAEQTSLKAPAGEGAFTLQAASFPNEAAAKEVADKLARAGVSAYVVSAEIPRRGKWYRVRAGRFQNAEEASRYSAQSRQRASSAGLSLQFVVVAYE